MPRVSGGFSRRNQTVGDNSRQNPVSCRMGLSISRQHDPGHIWPTGIDYNKLNEMAAPKIYDITLTKVIELSPTTKHFELTFPEPIDFKPGQFVMVKVVPGEGQKEIRRPYSICSVPRGKNTIEIVLNRVPGGFMSNYLCDQKEGAALKVQIPFGQFTLKEPIQDTLFVATGTGVAPFRCQIRWLLEDKKHTRPVNLLFGVRYENERLYHEEFEALARRYPHFKYVLTISRAAPEWTGLRGHVQTHLKEKFPKTTETDVYFCGVPAMIDETKKILLEMGFDPKRIHEEKYA